MKKMLLMLFVSLVLVGDLRADTNQPLQGGDAGSIEQDDTVEVFFLMNHEIKVLDGEDIAYEKERCINELVTKTKENLSVESYKVINITLDSKGNAETIRCKISVKTK